MSIVFSLFSLLCRRAFLKHTLLDFFAGFYLKMAVLEGAIKSHRYDEQETNMLISYYAIYVIVHQLRRDSVRNKAVNH